MLPWKHNGLDTDRGDDALPQVGASGALLSRELAQRAGEALAAVRGSTPIDAIVMASAASRGDVVYTSDVDDLTRLQLHFPGVRVLHV